MSRQKKTLEKVQEIIERGQKPSVKQLSEELKWPEPDVHRCLNALEKKDEIETYVKEGLNRKIRFVMLKR